MATTSDIAKGVILNINNNLEVVVESQFVSPGKGSAFYRVRLKSLSSGKVVERTFKSGENIDVVQVMRENMQYLYPEGENYAFMNMETYEQVLVDKDTLGDDAKYLKEGIEAMLMMYEGKAVAATLPKKITYKVTEAEPAVKGDTASGNVTKEVTLENGLKIQAPIFVKIGDMVVVNTETGLYSERANQSF